jgi:hypothetical protein
MITDPRDRMTLPELLEELEAAHPQEVAEFERNHSTAMEAVVENSYEQPEDTDDSALEEMLSDLCEDLRSRLRI